MSYGVRQDGKHIFCAQCGRVISESGEYKSNFCFVCGNPLKISAIAQREAEIEEAISKFVESAKGQNKK